MNPSNAGNTHLICHLAHIKPGFHTYLHIGGMGAKCEEFLGVLYGGICTPSFRAGCRKGGGEGGTKMVFDVLCENGTKHGIRPRPGDAPGKKCMCLNLLVQRDS